MSLILNNRLQCDLELLLNGGFSPLKGFLNEKDYKSVVENCRLECGTVWPMPIVLPVHSDDISQQKYNIGDEIILKDSTNLPLAKLTIEDIYEPDLDIECEKVLGANDSNHPYYNEVKRFDKTHYLGGSVEKINLPPHYDFCDIRKTPEEMKEIIKNKKWDRVVGFQTRNPMHRSHYELTKYAMKEANANLLLNPVVGVTQECDIDYFTRVKCYKKLINYYPENSAELCLLPLSMRMAGPREAVWHAIIRKNYGCTHFIVGRDHAGPSYKKQDGSDFYGAYDAQYLLEKYAGEIGIEVVTSKLIVYAEPKDGGNPIYSAIDKIDKEKYNIMNISGTKQREILRKGEKLPEWFTFPEIEKELVNKFKLENNKGACIYLIGLSGSGKSTLANVLKTKLLEYVQDKKITILDGDVVRQHLSKGLSFSKEDRSINIQRIGYVASEVVKHGGIAICANIAPFEEDRKFNRKLINKEGHYVEIFVDTKLEDCESRDVKGLYKLARQGKIPNFTGISDPFEEPLNCDLKLDGGNNISIEENMNTIIKYLGDNNIL